MRLDEVRRLSTTFLTAALLSLAAQQALAQYSEPNTAPATHDDCKIIAEIMNSKTENPLSGSSFGAACRWQTLGLKVQTTTATEGWRVFFNKPDYDAAHANATITYSDSYDGANNFHGSHEYRCSLAKQSERWQIKVCVPDVIAN